MELTLTDLANRPEFRASRFERQERRRFLRVPLRCPAMLSAKGDQIEARAVDISLGGIFVIAPPLPVETPVVLQVGTLEKILFHGTVLRSEERKGRSGLVIQFSRLTPRSMWQLATYLNRF
jgi:hypothetical protein